MPKYVINPDGTLYKYDMKPDGTIWKVVPNSDSENATTDYISTYLSKNGESVSLNSAIDSLSKIDSNIERVETNEQALTSGILDDSFFSVTKVKSKNLVNDSHNFLKPDKITNYLDEEIVETILNFNSTLGDKNIFASELEISGGISTEGISNFDQQLKKILLPFQILANGIVHIAAAEAIFAINKIVSNAASGYNDNQDIEENYHLYYGENGHIDTDFASSFLFKRLNYPRSKIRSASDIDERISAYIIGFVEILSGDNLLDLNKITNKLNRDKNFLRDVQSKYGILPMSGFKISGLLGASLHAFTKIAVTLTQVGINRLMLIERKISHQRQWLSKLYNSKQIDTKNVVDTYFSSFNYYFFKFIVERMHIGLKLIRYYEFGASYDTHLSLESSYNRVGLSKSGVKSDSRIRHYQDNYMWQLKNTGNKNSQSTRIRSLPQSFIMPESFAAFNESVISETNTGNHSIVESLLNNFSLKMENDTVSNKRLSSELVTKIERYLDSEYVPFYFHDLRTNEIISFHAFIDNISDSYSPEYTTHTGFGRVDDIKHYVKTTRSISLSFTVASTSKEDHDLMWYQINKIVAMTYPQWSEGIENKKLSNIKYPFSQVPTNSPLIRLRVGDVIKSNYSRDNLLRKFGAENLLENIGENSITRDETLLQNKKFDPDNGGINEISNNSKDLLGDYNANIQVDLINRSTLKSESIQQSGSEVLQKNFDILRTPFTEHSKNFTLIPGLYRAEEKDKNSFLDIIGLGGSGKQYVHIKNYEKIAFIKEDFDILNRENIKQITVGLVNKNYENLIFFVDTYSIIKTFHRTIENDITKPSIPIKQEEDTGASDPFDNDDTADSNSNNKISNQEIFDEITKVSKLKKDSSVFEGNPILGAYESSKGKGLAGFITNLDINYNDQLWETSDINAKAPQIIKVTISYSPIHDIPLGLDHKGMLTSPAYNVGNLNRKLFSDPHGDIDNLEFEKDTPSFDAPANLL